MIHYPSSQKMFFSPDEYCSHYSSTQKVSDPVIIQVKGMNEEVEY